MNDLPSGDLLFCGGLVRQSSIAIVCIEDPKPGFVSRPGAAIFGKGWVLASHDLEDIKVYIGERFAGYALYGGIRSDIAKRFPTYPQADQSGFSFAVDMPPVLAEPAEDLTVVVRTVGGCEHRKVVPRGEAGRPVTTGSSVAIRRPFADADLWPVRLTLDEARIDHQGLLRVRGWALTKAPLKELRLFLGPTALNEPELGIPRPDVARDHPDYPSAGACGFRLVQEMGAERHKDSLLRIRAVCEGGNRRQIIAPIERASVKRQAAANIGGIRFCCEHIGVGTNGTVLLFGWAFAETRVISIAVQLDGVAIGEAAIGLARPDISNRFPRVASALHSGFSFTRTVSTPIEGAHVLTLRICDANGAQQEFPVPVHVDESDATLGATAASDIRFDLDTPELIGDRARDPIATTLTIRGWAVAGAGIEHIAVKLDDRCIGHAYHGIRRDDVAAALPEFPGALLSGFGMHIGAHLIDEGEHSVTLIVRGNDGETVERCFQVVRERSSVVPSWETIRPRIGHVEVAQGLAHLDEADTPSFDVHIRLPDATAGSLAAARSTLASLDAQGYPHWQAIIAAHDVSAASAALDELTGDDPYLLPRISVFQDAHDQDRASFVCMLRAGDRLGADALLEFAVHAALNRGHDFIYSDDRRRDEADGSSAPFFKPEWSPDLLLGFNYIGRAWCARPSVLAAAGIEQRHIGALGDYAAVLRLTESAGAIGHVPKMLVDVSDSAATEQDHRQALADSVMRDDVPASVMPGAAKATFRVRREVAAGARVSIIIPTIAARGLIEAVIGGLRNNTSWRDIEIVCLDNISPLGAERHWKDWLLGSADKVIEIAEPFNWSRFNNAGAAVATGDYLLFLNDDIEVTEPDWLEVMLGHAQRPEVGVVGPRLLYPDGKVQHGGMFFTRHGGQHAFRFAAPDDPGPFGLALCDRNVIAVTGACLLTRRDVFVAVGGFNEAHAVVNNDVDYCLRVRRAGYRVVYTPYATLVHHELVSRARLADVYDEKRFRAEWGSVFAKGDPFFNPNLSQDSDHFAPNPEPVEMVYAGRPSMASETVQRILAVKLDHIGDFVTALPALRRLKQRFANAELYVLAANASAAIARLEPYIDGVIEFNFFHVRSGDGQRSVTEAELEALRERLRPYRFDVAVDLRMHPDTRRVLQFTGARLVAGFQHADTFSWLDVALHWEGDERLALKRTHVSDRLTQLVEALAIACEAQPAGLQRSSLAQARSHIAGLVGQASMPNDFFGSPVVCVHPGVGSDIRQWPADHFAMLIDLLVEDGAKVMLIGVGDEVPIALSVLGKVARPDAVLSLVGRTSLEDLIQVLQAATLYVGNNSGPKHLAATLGVPTLGIHSAVVDATEWGPVGPNAAAIRRKMQCGPCYLGSASQCHRRLECLTGLLPGDVYRACRKLLGREVTIRSNDAGTRHTHGMHHRNQVGQFGDAGGWPQ